MGRKSPKSWRLLLPRPVMLWKRRSNALERAVKGDVSESYAPAIDRTSLAEGRSQAPTTSAASSPSVRVIDAISLPGGLKALEVEPRDEQHGAEEEDHERRGRATAPEGYVGEEDDSAGKDGQPWVVPLVDGERGDVGGEEAGDLDDADER
jgi:hypothetical protein